LSQDPLFLAIGDPRGLNLITRQNLLDILADPQALRA
jgi:hypothetical protein